MPHDGDEPAETANQPPCASPVHGAVKKIVLISILLATILIPTRAANDPNPRQALKKALLYSVLFNVVYWLLLLFVYPRLD